MFPMNTERLIFLDLVKELSGACGVKILAYCMMDNHCDFVLENASGKLNDFIIQLAGRYADSYHQKYGGSGNVFRKEYDSIFIQDKYIKPALLHVLRFPVREDIADEPDDYLWSSAADHFQKEIADVEAVKQLFGSHFRFIRAAQAKEKKQLKILNNKHGRFLADKSYIETTIKVVSLFDEEEPAPKKTAPAETTPSVEPGEPEPLSPIDAAIAEFEKSRDLKLKNVDFHTLVGKKLRGDLLYFLREHTKLTYPEIHALSYFQGLQASSLGRLFQLAKLRVEKGGTISPQEAKKTINKQTQGKKKRKYTKRKYTRRAPKPDAGEEK